MTSSTRPAVLSAIRARRHNDTSDDRTQQAVADSIDRSTSEHRVPTASFENDFRARLHELVGLRGRRAAAPRRATIAALTTALRGGVEVEQLLAIVRDVTAEELADAYGFIEGVRSDAEIGLDRFLADPTPESLGTNMPAMRRLMPGPTNDLLAVANRREELFALAQSIRERTATLSERARRIEERADAEADAGHRLVQVLDDGREGGLFHEPAYRPTRVGDIVPMRLEHLFGFFVDARSA